MLLIYPKWIEPTRTRFMRFLTSLTGEVKIEKIAIAPEPGARLLRPLNHLFWCVVAWDSRPSRDTAFAFAPWAMVGAFPPIFFSHTWYVRCGRSVCYSHVLKVVLSRGSPPAC